MKVNKIFLIIFYIKYIKSYDSISQRTFKKIENMPIILAKKLNIYEYYIFIEYN